MNELLIKIMLITYSLNSISHISNKSLKKLSLLLTDYNNHYLFFKFLKEKR